jgi:allantoinase
MEGSRLNLDLILRGADVYLEGRLQRVDLGVASGRVIYPLPVDASAQETLDVRGCIILPGMIDTHVHFREPGRTDKEDFESGTRSAVLGGVTTVLEIQNNEPLMTDVATLRAKHALVGSKSWCHYGLYANVGLENLAKLGELAEEACAFKVFMTQSVGPLTVTGLGDLWSAMQAVRPTGRVLAVHAESDSICKVAKLGLEDSFASHAKSRPALAEAIAVAEALELAEATGTSINLAHLSTARSVELVRAAKQRGVRVSAATCTHYLRFTDEDVAREGSVLKVNPPIKSAKDRAGLLAGLKDGTVDHVHSDHAPHTPAEKALAWSKAPSGIAGIQQQLLELVEIWRRDGISLDTLVSATSSAPALAFGLRNKGRLAHGAEADLVVVDLETPTVVSQESLATRARSTPWMGVRFQSSIRATIVGGHLACESGRCLGQPQGQRVLVDRMI